MTLRELLQKNGEEDITVRVYTSEDIVVFQSKYYEAIRDDVLDREVSKYFIAIHLVEKPVFAVELATVDGDTPAETPKITRR